MLRYYRGDEISNSSLYNLGILLYLEIHALLRIVRMHATLSNNRTRISELIEIAACQLDAHADMQLIAMH